MKTEQNIMGKKELLINWDSNEVVPHILYKVAKDIEENSKDINDDIVDMVNEEFWDLI